MKRMMISAILTMGLTFSISGAGWAADPMTGFLDKPGPRAQAACPVQGGKINKDLYVDYQGQRVYFCCPECLPIFKKNPERYLQKMRESGVVPEKSPGAK
jgi:YHS domain-containing protein